jgi:adenine-specific DNA-methyltransferase
MPLHFSQIPELTDTSSAASRLGYQTISAITIERVKRVIQGYGDNPQPIPDIGFKVYKLTKSNFPRCEFTPDPKASEEENVAALRRYIHEKEAAFLFPLEEQAEQAVFDEVLLKCGFQLHYSRARRDDFAENTVFAVTDGKRSALVCLAWNEPIKDSTLKQLRHLDEAGDKPFFICLERSLTTTAKWNLDHLLGKRLTAF